MSDQETLAEFVTRRQLTISPVRIISRPDQDESDTWARRASHWCCSLSFVGQGGRSVLTVFYSQGSAHNKRPTTVEVLESLILDANGTDEPFESWCDNLGHDSDSRKAERIYQACRDIAKRLRKFLGEFYAEALAAEQP